MIDGTYNTINKVLSRYDVSPIVTRDHLEAMRQLQVPVSAMISDLAAGAYLSLCVSRPDLMLLSRDFEMALTARAVAENATQRGDVHTFAPDVIRTVIQERIDEISAFVDGANK